MFAPGTILYFTPFYFENGSPPKNKYFIILSHVDDDLIVVSLPTSKDHVPAHLDKIHGCIDDEKSCFNCYYFETGIIISECGSFSFPLDTYVYGEQVDTMNYSLLTEIYKVENKDYIKLGRLSENEFSALRECLIKSSRVKRKIKKLLSKII